MYLAYQPIIKGPFLAFLALYLIPSAAALDFGGSTWI
jgi:hypothetical protein